MSRSQAFVLAVAVGVALAAHPSLAQASPSTRSAPARSALGVPHAIGIGLRVFVDGVELVDFDSTLLEDFYAKPDLSRPGVHLGVRF